MEAEIHDKREGEETENSTNPVGGIGIEVETETIIAIKSEDTEIVSAEDGDLSPKTEILLRSEEEEEEGKRKEPKLDTNDCVINVTPEPEPEPDPDPGSGSPGGESLRAEKVCRICHLSSEMSESLELIQLGCCCKGELGVSHRQCAETWFKHRGNRECEICGKTARNITGMEQIRFMVEWNEMRMMSASAANSSPRRGSCLPKNSFCNFLLVCLVLAFILPWFFRVDIL